MKKANMKEMACEERPYERCEQFGASNLTDSELLAVLLRTGTRGENALQLADKILHPVFSQKGVLNLHQWTYEQLMQIKGIGKVKAIQILCLAELSKTSCKSNRTGGTEFFKPGVHCQILYGRFKTCKSGTDETAAFEYKIQTDRGDGYLEGNREFSSDFTEGAVCGGTAEECSVHCAFA